MKSLWNTRIRAFSAAALVLATLSEVYAGGFSIYEQGGRATAQAGAVVARPWDASAAFYNPAGLAFYGGAPGTFRFYAGLTPVQSMAKFSGSNPSPGRGVRDESKPRWFPPLFIYSMYQINENMSAGLAITTPYGLGTKWNNSDSNYSGRFRSVEGNIQVVYISPTFSYRINNQWGIGVGIDYVFSKVLLRRNSAQPFFDGVQTRVYDVASVKLTGEDKFSLGFHVAAYGKINEQLSVGIDYKHTVKNKYDGIAQFHQITHPTSDPYGSLVVDRSVAQTFADPLFGGMRQSGSTEVDFPANLVVGAAYKATEKLTVELDLGYAMWDVFKQVVIKFPEQRTRHFVQATNTFDTIPAPNSVLEENYKNAWQIRLGAEYDLNEKIQLRCGYIFDKTPAPTNTINPLLPDANRNDFSIGLGYKVNENLHIDAAYMAVLFSERSTKGKNLDGYDGTYNTHVNLLSLGIGYTFTK